MVLVPAGTVTFTWRGRLEGEPVAKKVAAFFMDKREVTVWDYRVASHEVQRRPKPIARSELADHPMTTRARTLAAAYCRWVDKRLPTPEEWQLAAAGPEGRTYPWGEEEPADDHLCWRRAGPCPVGSKPKGATPLGIADLAGNVQEYSTADGCWLKRPNIPCQHIAPLVHGGDWNDCALASKCDKPASRTTRVDHFEIPETVGFRCVRDAS